MVIYNRIIAGCQTLPYASPYVVGLEKTLNTLILLYNFCKTHVFRPEKHYRAANPVAFRDRARRKASRNLFAVSAQRGLEPACLYEKVVSDFFSIDYAVCRSWLWIRRRRSFVGRRRSFQSGLKKSHEELISLPRD
ncbi:MAG: hypothetical protein LBS65_10605, partial [Desulfovibrio sp.]|nr:hypothetical protein [Desulfovibrio sp.]